MKQNIIVAIALVAWIALVGFVVKVFVDRASDIPDELIPNSFRLMRDFVRTLEDMPPGTIESIMANPYF